MMITTLTTMMMLIVAMMIEEEDDDDDMCDVCQGAEVAKRINDEERGARAAVKIIGTLPQSPPQVRTHSSGSPLTYSPTHRLFSSPTQSPTQSFVDTPTD